MDCSVKYFQTWTQSLFQRNFKNSASGLSICHVISASDNHESKAQAEAYVNLKNKEP